MVDNLPLERAEVVGFVTPPGATESVKKCRQFRVSGFSVVRERSSFREPGGWHYPRWLRVTLFQTVYPVYRAASSQTAYRVTSSRAAHRVTSSQAVYGVTLSQTAYRVTSSQAVYRVTFSQTAYRVTLSRADDTRDAGRDGTQDA